MSNGTFNRFIKGDKEDCDCEAVQALLRERERLLEEKDRYIALQDRMIEVLQKQNP